MVAFERFDVEKALEELTLQEKIALTTGADFWHTVPVERLGIPSVRLSDGPNGARGTRFFDSVPANCIPCGTGLGSTWDAELMREVGQFLGKEARSKGAHVLLGPTINIQRHPLNGRAFESFSEDPLLSGTIAGQYCLGLKDEKIIATPKHLVCNDKENERFGSDSVVSERAMREIYLTPFQIALKEGNPRTIMTAYNKVNGTHASENKGLIQDILRGEWGYDGLVMSDWFGTYSTSESVNAGCDIEMPGPSRFRGDILEHAVLAKKVPRHVLDDRVRNVLNLVNEAVECGIPESAPETTIDTPEARAFMRKVAANSVVLMKNQNNILPFDKNKPVLVIGPNSKVASYAGGGSASVTASYTVTPYEGVCNASNAEVAWTQGVYSHRALPDFGPMLRTPEGKQGFLFRAYNEPPSVADRECIEMRTMRKSESHLSDYKNDKLKGEEWYATIVSTFTPEESGLYDFGVVVIGSGRLFIDEELVVDNTHDQKQGTLFFGMGTEEVIGSKELVAGQTYNVRFEFGSTPTGDLKVANNAEKNGAFRMGCAKRIEYDISIKQAMEMASKYEQVVCFAGLNGEWESENIDREHMDLPAGSDDLIKAVLAGNPNAAICIQSGMPVTMPWADDTKALLWASFGGNEIGNGIADVLYGNVNPCAKLPVTFPRRVQDNPAFLNFGVDGGRILYGEDVYVGYRFYEKTEKDALFNFGHGLSYTTFSRENLQVAEDGEKLTVKVTVKNTGAVAGAEVVQLFIHPKSAAAVRRPVRELKAFKKVMLEAGESKDVEFDLEVKRVTCYWDEIRHEWCSEKGTYEVQIAGTGDKDVRAKFDVKKSTWWKGL